MGRACQDRSRSFAEERESLVYDEEERDMYSYVIVHELPGEEDWRM